jgi:hypothetical protein
MIGLEWRWRVIVGVVAIALLAVVSGCGSDGPRREIVTGRVTYQGTPVPRGKVIFEPAHGSSGPLGTATIVDGSFQTERGRGPAAGPLLVRVEFWLKSSNPPVPAPPMPDTGSRKSDTWHTAYRTSVDIPLGGGECTIDIPNSVRPGDQP